MSPFEVVAMSHAFQRGIAKGEMSPWFRQPLHVCCGNGSDSRDRGYVGEGRVLATAKLYTPIYEFRPLSEEVTALRLGVVEACWLECELQGVRTLVQEGRGGLYRVCPDPSQPTLQRV